MNKVMLLAGTVLLGATAAAAQTTTAPTGAAPAGAATASAPATPQVAVGAAVSDTSGGQVGTVSAVSGGNATIDTGSAKAAVPISSFAQGQSGLIIAMTKAQLEQAVAAQTQPLQIAVGNNVSGPQGNPVGKVTAVTGDLVTVQTATTKVQLPTKAFAQKAPGELVIGLTADQLDAAAKGAGAPSGG